MLMVIYIALWLVLYTQHRHLISKGVKEQNWYVEMAMIYMANWAITMYADNYHIHYGDVIVVIKSIYQDPNICKYL
jgi:hypothetical protein